MDTTTIKSSGHWQTLLHYLRTTDPTILANISGTGSNTRPDKTSWIQPKEIYVWEGFTMESLMLMYGGILEFVLSQRFNLKDFETEGSPFCSIYNEKTFEFLIVKWSLSLMAEALPKTHKLFGDYEIPRSDPVEMQGGGAAKRPAPGLDPDWAGTLRSEIPIVTKGDLPVNILPGETKLSSKWSSEDIVLGKVKGSFKKIDWLRPLTQLNTYCIESNARYGYIITDRELVAVRIRLGPSSIPNIPNESLNARARKTGIMEVKAIPWLDSTAIAERDFDTITINLALWWLHIMAAECRDIKEHYPRLQDTFWSGIPEEDQIPPIRLKRSHGSYALSRRSHTKRVIGDNNKTSKNEK